MLHECRTNSRRVVLEDRTSSRRPTSLAYHAPLTTDIETDDIAKPLPTSWVGLKGKGNVFYMANEFVHIHCLQYIRHLCRRFVHYKRKKRNYETSRFCMSLHIHEVNGWNGYVNNAMLR